MNPFCDASIIAIILMSAASKIYVINPRKVTTLAIWSLLTVVDVFHFLFDDTVKFLSIVKTIIIY